MRLTERHFLEVIAPSEKKLRPARKCYVCSLKKNDNGKRIRKETRYFCPDYSSKVTTTPFFANRKQQKVGNKNAEPLDRIGITFSPSRPRVLPNSRNKFKRVISGSMETTNHHRTWGRKPRLKKKAKEFRSGDLGGQETGPPCLILLPGFLSLYSSFTWYAIITKCSLTPGFYATTTYDNLLILFIIPKQLVNLQVSSILTRRFKSPHSFGDTPRLVHRRLEVDIIVIFTN
ncbi:piggyBac transposable element-derived protein 4 [Trichonephila clavipes]|nr:piggyBac transposable element-derived protein 4 [Trichonephila clavipes]